MRNRRREIGRLRFMAALFLALGAAGAGWHDAQAQEGRADYTADIRPVLAEHCFACHGEKKQKGDLRLDTLAPSFEGMEEQETWDKVREALAAHEMPPEDEKQPDDGQRARITGWIEAQLGAAALAAKDAAPAARTRRLTVPEYNRTLQDLFGVQVDFARTLPPDPISEQGYQNDAGLLTISTLQMEYCLEIARTAVAQQVVFGPAEARGEALHYHIEAEDVYYTTQDRTGKYSAARQWPRPSPSRPPSSAPLPEMVLARPDVPLNSNSIMPKVAPQTIGRDVHPRRP
jgi:mono/diheme cytochrome c family protein